ncbi:hypothetical protein QBC37DRAFT_435442 [Rhypophila decipiens]|uniref:Uncharacterized protein n=1 Tax=Rhypophila decipiens TaxID=261697 RepID=A0AAN6XUR1_9PEZI|nr:hypothetical protein QBC37DRAFT_435442 [Rhypophila decipiens]
MLPSTAFLLAFAAFAAAGPTAPMSPTVERGVTALLDKRQCASPERTWICESITRYPLDFELLTDVEFSQCCNENTCGGSHPCCSAVNKSSQVKSGAKLDLT